jgi:putative endonuclease
VVAAHLRRLGYKLLAANVRSAGYEIDLLTLDDDVLVVVEVRATSSNEPLALIETAASVNQRKQERLTRAALAFLARRRALGKIPVRFDVIIVVWPPHQRHPLIHHIPDAFRAQGQFQFFN